ncbi:MAG: DUF1579 family protein [Planctomycetes bacterium]|nr:DUF1579 family protein [Planctomycetota bacterium]
MAGEWVYDNEAVIEPGQPPARSKGTESDWAIGGIWVVGESKGKTPTGASMTAILTLGYDPQKKKFVGTWIDTTPRVGVLVHRSDRQSP